MQISTYTVYHSFDHCIISALPAQLRRAVRRDILRERRQTTRARTKAIIETRERERMRGKWRIQHYVGETMMVEEMRLNCSYVLHVLYVPEWACAPSTGTAGEWIHYDSPVSPLSYNREWLLFQDAAYEICLKDVTNDILASSVKSIGQPFPHRTKLMLIKTLLRDILKYCQNF